MAQEHSNGDVQIPAADSVEFRLLMGYARKRRPTDTRLQQDVPEREPSSVEPSSVEPSSVEPSEETQKAKRNHKKKRFRSFILKCIKPKTDDALVPQPAMVKGADDGKACEIENMVIQLTKISDSCAHIKPHMKQQSDIESDGDDDDVVKRLADMLRVHGDELAEKIKEDKLLSEALKSSFKYNFFKQVMDTFCRTITSELPTEQKDQKVDVALICEATSQLCGVNYHPMNRTLGFGAKYLQDEYSKWISRNLHVGNGEVGDDSKEEVH